MNLLVFGRTAIDERCCCRCCGHLFTTSQALTKVTVGSALPTDATQLLICCPSCRSEDVIART